MEQARCSRRECGRAVKAAGLCKPHYNAEPKGGPRPCSECGSQFTAVRAGHVFCGEKCRSSATHRRNAVKRRVQMSAWRAANPDLRRAYYERTYDAILDRVHARRARLLGEGYAPVERAEVWTRCRGLCHLCGGSVPVVVRYPHPLSASMDHVVPLSRGGVHAPHNVKLAHLVCNMRKGARGGLAT